MIRLGSCPASKPSCRGAEDKELVMSQTPYGAIAVIGIDCWVSIEQLASAWRFGLSGGSTTVVMFSAKIC
jgi:hypothetical protein